MGAFFVERSFLELIHLGRQNSLRPEKRPIHLGRKTALRLEKRSIHFRRQKNILPFYSEMVKAHIEVGLHSRDRHSLAVFGNFLHPH